MFTREDLASKSFEQLQQLAKDLGIEPVGNPGYPNSWIVGLLVAGKLGLIDCDNGIGLRRFPSAKIIEHLEAALDELGQPTPAQRTLIKAALQNRWLYHVRVKTYHKGSRGAGGRGQGRKTFQLFAQML